MTNLAHQLTRQVKLLHKAVIINQDQVLILKRVAEVKSRPNCWDLPGGNSEWPASNTVSQFNLHQLDIKREIQEETGFLADQRIFDLPHLIYFSTFFDQTAEVYSIICGWRVLASEIENFKANQVQIQIKEHSQYSWVNQANLSNYDFGQAKGKFLIEIINHAFHH